MGNISSRERKRGIDAYGVPAPGRPTKRSKLIGDSGDDALVASPSLPSEVWAMVMNHLEFRSVLSCAVTSRAMLHEAMPLVTSIHIDKASEMNASVAMRFREVKDVNLYSLLSPSPTPRTPFRVDREAVMRATQFIHYFPQVENLFFGGRDSAGNVVSLSSLDPAHDSLDQSNKRKVLELIGMISVSFRFSGGLANHIRIRGLRCPNSHRRDLDTRASSCIACQQACRSFPLQSVLNFDNKGSSESCDKSPFGSKKQPCLDVCLARTQIESIVESRPGGSELLRSDARLLHLLGRGHRYEIPSDDGKSLVIVAFGQSIVREMERVIEVAQLDVKTIPSHTLTEALIKSFSKDGRAPTTPKNRCFIAPFNMLRDRIGLPIDSKDFTDPIRSNAKNLLPQIAKGITNGNKQLQSDCAGLLGSAMYFAPSSTIQNIIELDLVPKLVDLAKSSTPNATLALSFMALQGQVDAIRALIDAGAIPVLIAHTTCSSKITKKTACAAMQKIHCVLKDQEDESFTQGFILSVCEMLNGTNRLHIMYATAALAKVAGLTSNAIEIPATKVQAIKRGLGCTEEEIEKLLNKSQEEDLSESIAKRKDIRAKIGTLLSRISPENKNNADTEQKSSSLRSSANQGVK